MASRHQKITAYRCPEGIAVEIGGKRLTMDEDQARHLHDRLKFALGRNRTLTQNSLLHLWFREIALQSGHTPEEVKEALVSEFLGRRLIYVGKIPHTVRLSTADLERSEFSALLERIQALAAEMDWYLTQPTPEDQKRWMT